MEKDRLTAFSDGVIAVIITIMVLELKPPDEASLAGLAEAMPVFLCYVLSFVYVAIYWNNHHHFFHLVTRVNGAMLWANMHLLFWMSLIPFATAWMGERHFVAVPTAAYGVVLAATAIAWWIMQTVIIRAQGPQSPLKRALGADVKGKASPVLYAVAIAAAFVATWISDVLYVAVALMWLVPDRRIEAAISR